MMQVSDDSEYWRRLAEEARSEAEQITKTRAKQTMLNVAETYDAMARGVRKPPRNEPAVKLAEPRPRYGDLAGVYGVHGRARSALTQAVTWSTASSSCA